MPSRMAVCAGANRSTDSRLRRGWDQLGFLGDASRHPDVKKFASAASVVVSNDKDYLDDWVSYKLDLTGPSVNVQSACSTSLVATSLGVNSLLAYQCDLALAGGATIEIPEKKGYLYQEGGMESPDGHCRPFDANAKGTVFSRGAGVVLLKRLDDAIRDRDNIYAVILAGATNNDGSLKAGFTAPSVKGQVEVAVEALEGAGVSAVFRSPSLKRTGQRRRSATPLKSLHSHRSFGITRNESNSARWDR